MKHFTSNRRFKRIAQFLEQPNFKGFNKKDLFILSIIKKGWGQDIAALSNMAEAITNLAVSYPDDIDRCRYLSKEVIKRALHHSVSPYKKHIRDIKSLGKFGYYLEHLNIILGSYRRIADDDTGKQLNKRITDHLIDNSNQHKDYHADLLPNVNMKWSADQAAILYSIWLYDMNNSTNLSSDIISNWIRYMDTYQIHSRTGLYKTEVLGTRKYSNQPRGCSHSYMTHYMGRFAPDNAKKQWELYKKHMMGKIMGRVAFREYLPSYKGKWTPDSGPLIGGYGVAATGLALNAASTMDDKKTFRKIEKTMNPFGSALYGTEMIFGNNFLTRIGTDLLASSIWLNAETKQKWYFSN